MRKAKVNYWVDLSISISFLLSAASGLVFLLPGDLTSGILGLGYQAWNDVHTWSSLALISGVGAHLALHWQWMVSMTRGVLLPASPRQAPKPASDTAHGEARDPALSRRAFLALSGMAVAAAGGVLIGYKVASDTAAAEAGEGSSLTAEPSQANSLQTMTQTGTCIACRHGLVNDPYPGRCRDYVDSDGDGFCDYSTSC